jgi:hypothetical protein
MVKSEISLSYSHSQESFYHSDAIYHRKCRTNSITWHENPGLTSNRFHFLAKTIISQYHRRMQGQGHIRVKKIFENILIGFNIFFCFEILGKKINRSLGSLLRYVRKCTLYWKTPQWDWSIFGSPAGSLYNPMHCGNHVASVVVH